MFYFPSNTSTQSEEMKYVHSHIYFYMHIWSILFKWWLIDHCKDLVEASPEDRNIILHTWITNPLFSLHFIRICDICRHQTYINRKRRFCINHSLADFLRPRHNDERPFDFSILLHGSKANYWVLDILTYWPCTQHIVQKFAYYLEVPIPTLLMLIEMVCNFHNS